MSQTAVRTTQRTPKPSAGARFDTALGWSPRFEDFETGLADTVQWYRDHEAWWRPAKQQTEAFYASKGQ